ncbi:MAG: hypothetical protein RL302_103, partial [Pseudomonadota bacterium]
MTGTPIVADAHAERIGGAHR